MFLSRHFAVAIATGSLFCFAFVLGADTSPEPQENKSEARRKALSKLNPLIGQWRGVGRPQRYRVNGAWQEQADWIWAFEENGPTLKHNVKDGKWLQEAELSWDIDEQQYALQSKLVDGKTLTYHGQVDGGKLLLTTGPDPKGDVWRLRITMLNPKRTLVLLQKQIAGRGSFARVHEVGYTREGTRLAKDALGGPECVVTGGLGTIGVTHDGMKYFVCCTGCRDVFNEEPEATLKAYAERVAKRKAEEAKQLEAEKRLIGVAK